MKLKREKVSYRDRRQTAREVVSVGVACTTGIVIADMFMNVAIRLGMTTSLKGIAGVTVSSMTIGSMVAYYTSRYYTRREPKNLLVSLFEYLPEKDSDIEELKSFN